ncbi:hypothetical protein [Solimonas marina]|uniref:Uncharacterized protein n=1 Tax=Solimonas marina TaxID=2714601 RepID=A0A969W757_9GAMM|nr:hypothetical protein [Solimonas marina]NKF21926.1 hypothetical protein [Solimonas marina]
MKAQVTFETDFFQPVAGEEEKTNPGRFGQALAEWLQTQLRKRGVEVEGIIPEDFGWVVMVSRRPFMLWLGCGNTDGSTTEWSIFPVAEPSLLQRLFKPQTIRPAVDALWEHVKAIVPSIPLVRGITWE